MANWIGVHEQAPPLYAAFDIWVDYQDLTGRLCNCFYNHKNNKYWYWDDKCKNKIQLYSSYVTHWMPLPPPPVMES